MEEHKNRFEGMSQADINRENMDPAGYWQWKTERMFPRERDAAAKRKLDVIVKITERIHGPVGWTNDMTDVVLNGDVPEDLLEEWARLSAERNIAAKEKRTPRKREIRTDSTKSAPQKNIRPEFVPPTLASKYFEAMEAKEDGEDTDKT